MGQYDHIIKRLPRVLNTEPHHQEKVDAVKKAMLEDPNFKQYGAVLAAKYAVQRGIKDAIQAELSMCQVTLDAISQLMASQFENEGTTSVTLSNGDKIRIEPGIHPKIEDHEAFRLWCFSDPDLSKKMTLHSSTASSLIKQLLIVGEPEPPGVKAVVWDKIVYTPGDGS